MTLVTGHTLHNRYRIVKLVGQGGFGAVYRGWDMSLDRPVAVKEHFDTGSESQRQFEHEAKLLASLRHSNLPIVFDHFMLPNGQYLVMDFVEGKSLHDMLIERGSPLDEAKVLPWICQVCDALEYLHTHEPPIIHRDIKPENIIVTDEGRAILVDFGISKLYDPGKGTMAGAKAVTPGYSPLEQYGRGRTDARSDVYSLGATLYSLLTGKIPPEAPDLISGTDVLMSPREVNPAVSEAASAAVVAAMTPAISQRLVSAAALSHMLLVPASDRQAPKESPAVVPARSIPTKGRESYPVWGWIASVVGLLASLVWAGIVLDGRNDVREAATSKTEAAQAIVDDTPHPTATAESYNLSRDGIEVPLVFVPAGSFWMGSEDNYAQPNEGPRHRVTLDAFWMGETEVTNAQYERCVINGKCPEPTNIYSSTRKEHPYYGNALYSYFPVIYVTWYDADIFCKSIGGRLPTEAEWEYAARGQEVDQSQFPWGNREPLKEWANLSGWKGDTIRVGKSFRDKSWVDAMDMAGNVREWVNDWFWQYSADPVVNPQGHESGKFRVLRGGAWSTAELMNARSAARGAMMPNLSGDFLGFRCAADFD